MYARLLKIFLIWGGVVSVTALFFSIFFQTLVLWLFDSESGHLLSIPFNLAVSWFAGYRAVKSSITINNIAKITTPFWTGMGVGLTSMLILSLVEYFTVGSFSFGSGILVAFAAGFGGKMAVSKR